MGLMKNLFHYVKICSFQWKVIEIFLNGAEFSLNLGISANSGNLINHRSMNLAQIQDHVSDIRLAGFVVAS